MITGTYMYNALASGNADAVATEADTLDVCYSHPTGGGALHYHFSGSCMRKGKGWWGDIFAPPLCASKDGCTTDPYDFTIAATAPNQTDSPTYSADTWDSPIGLAKDGHVIMGLMNEDGEAH